MTGSFYHLMHMGLADYASIKGGYRSWAVGKGRGIQLDIGGREEENHTYAVIEHKKNQEYILSMQCMLEMISMQMHLLIERK